ncbi:MAG: hypothetical protein E6K70_04970 [Planctomycetota bacterium]|nr:MAG: hypothetical protein E6K70_04970 [Planctomycetota bacterium]
MRRRLAGGLALSAALWAASAWAGDGQAPASRTAGPTAVKADSATDYASFVSMGRPEALEAPAANQSKRPPLNDRQLKPAMFVNPLLERGESVVRGQSPDTPQPLPAGPSLDVDAGKPESGTSDTPEKLKRPRLMPSAQPPPSTNSSHIVADSGDCSDGAPECNGGACCDGWRRPLCCLMSLWQPGDCLNNPYDIWFRGEYLLWAVKDAKTPPLVTTSPPGTPRAGAGILTTPGTTVLFGGPNVDLEERSGARFTLGFWFDSEQTCGLEASYFFLGDRTVNFNAGSNGLPILARPFFNASTGLEDAELVAFPGVLTGNIAVNVKSALHGADIDFRTNLWRGCCWRMDLLAGYRYLSLNESINIAENLVVPAGAPFAGTNIGVWDNFGTHNTFNGGELGLDLELRQRRWSLNFLGKVALGSMHEVVNINGNTSFTVPMSTPIVQMGGLLALPTNIGHFTTDRFAVVPEVGVRRLLLHLRQRCGPPRLGDRPRHQYQPAPHGNRHAGPRRRGPADLYAQEYRFLGSGADAGAGVPVLNRHWSFVIGHSSLAWRLEANDE